MPELQKELALNFCKIVRDGVVVKFFDYKENKPIHLYPGSVKKLVEVLPQAVDLFAEADKRAATDPNLQETCYAKNLHQAGCNKVALEINLYNGRAYLFVKRYFKPQEQPDVWLPCRGSVMLEAHTSSSILDFLQQPYV